MTRRLRSAVCLVVAVAALSSVAVAGTAPAASDRHFMWTVSADNGAEIHLLGSVHAMNDDIYPLAPVIEKAYASSDVVVFEVDLGDLQTAAKRMLQRGALPTGTTLKDVVSPAVYEKTMAYLDDAGLPRSGFDLMRPWMLALTLTSLELAKNGFAAENGVDMYFFGRAKADDKKTVGLEGVEFQVDLFANLSDEESEAFLRYSLDEMEMVIPLMKGITAHWQAGEAQQIEEFLTAAFADYPELYATIVTDRNQKWLQQMEALLEDGRKAMVVVGSLHLVGEDGLVAQLADRGYHVVQR